MLGEPFLNSLAMIYLRDRPEIDSGGPDHQIRPCSKAADKVVSTWLVAAARSGTRKAITRGLSPRRFGVMV